jgi:hypothetical protein
MNECCRKLIDYVKTNLDENKQNLEKNINKEKIKNIIYCFLRRIRRNFVLGYKELTNFIKDFSKKIEDLNTKSQENLQSVSHIKEIKNSIEYLKEIKKSDLKDEKAFGNINQNIISSCTNNTKPTETNSKSTETNSKSTEINTKSTETQIIEELFNICCEVDNDKLNFREIENNKIISIFFEMAIKKSKGRSAENYNFSFLFI